MIYNVRTQEWEKTQAFSKGGHTDFGSLTLLFSQHVAGLQIRTSEEKWKYVKPVTSGVTCNAADTLTFYINGELASYLSSNSLADITLCFIKSTIHFVITLPKDQINVPRLGLLYFSRPVAHTLM